MTDSSDKPLRDYLIGILAADGPEAAERRLALRQSWHQQRSDRSAAIPARPQSPGATNRQDDWAKFEEVADRAPEADDAEILRQLQCSAWADVQTAAQQLEAVRRHWQAILELWPKELAASLAEIFLRILSQPATRTAELREQFRQHLHSSSSALKAFRRFVAQFRRKFPELTACDPELLNDLLRPVQLVTKRRLAKPPTQPVQPNKMGTATVIICGIVGGMLGGLSSLTKQSHHAPIHLPPAVEQSKSQEMLQEIIKGLKTPQLSDVPHHDPLADSARIATRILLGLEPEDVDYDSEIPADALRPANGTADGESP